MNSYRQSASVNVNTNTPPPPPPPPPFSTENRLGGRHDASA